MYTFIIRIHILMHIHTLTPLFTHRRTPWWATATPPGLFPSCVSSSLHVSTLLLQIPYPSRLNAVTWKYTMKRYEIINKHGCLSVCVYTIMNRMVVPQRIYFYSFDVINHDSDAFSRCTTWLCRPITLCVSVRTRYPFLLCIIVLHFLFIACIKYAWFAHVHVCIYECLSMYVLRYVCMLGCMQYICLRGFCNIWMNSCSCWDLTSRDWQK